jgi:hypothetical protein
LQVGGCKIQCSFGQSIFRLINCIFSDDLSSAACGADNVDQSALDSGAVGDSSLFWKLCEERFNNGFLDNSIDGPTPSAWSFFFL